VSPERPNILFVMADQLAASALGAYGNSVVQSPTIDRLAEDGVVFESAYCNVPLCAPSRASLLTGRLVSRVGVFDNAAELASSVPTIAHYLRARGYVTYLAGKMHFIGPDQLHGFEHRLTTDVYPAGIDWIPDWTRPTVDRLPWYHDMSSVRDAGPSEATLQLDYDEEVAFRSVRALYDLARREDERPFFLLASYTHPHDPYEISQEYWSRYRTGVELPRVEAIPFAEADAHSRRIREMCGTDEANLTDEDVRRARRGYYAAVSYVDDKVGELLRALAATGLRENTIVVFASDHGDMLGERGLWYKMTFFEDSARVPLVINAPARFAPGRVADIVSLADLLPTMVELAAPDEPFEPADALEGSSLVSLLRGEAGKRDRTIAAEYLAEGTHAPCVMLRRGPFKYISCPNDPEQLFDLRNDPRELVNLATGGTHPELAAFRAKVAERWDLEALHSEILGSQRRRLLVRGALELGRSEAWDYVPPEDSTTRYVRGQEFWAPLNRARLRRPSSR
jgi:choline-sulfatase